MFFCFMMIFVMAFNTVNVQAGALDYLGNTIDGSVLTNENEAVGTYKSVARSKYLLEGFVRITNNGNGYIGISKLFCFAVYQCLIEGEGKIL
mgnify:CR=1 FL=1